MGLGAFLAVLVGLISWFLSTLGFVVWMFNGEWVYAGISGAIAALFWFVWFASLFMNDEDAA